MQNYDLNPLILEDKSYKLNDAVLCMTIGVLVVSFITISYLRDTYFPFKNGGRSSFLVIMIANFSAIIFSWITKYFLPGKKGKNSYFYFKNSEIIQKKKNNSVIKTIIIKDIKILKKSFKHPDFFPGVKFDTLQDFLSFIGKILVVGFVFFAYAMMVPNYFIYIVMYVAMVLFSALIFFRIFDGLNLDILKNNVLIQTDDDRIILLNLTKSEFDKLKKYFKSLGKDIV